MRRLLLSLGVMAVMTSFVPQSQAGDFWHRFWLDFHRNHAWPQPFNHIDRQATIRPWNLMMHNGWRKQNTVSGQLFDRETNSLTRAGRLKVRWIASQAPLHRRTVYVLRGHTSEITEARLESVRAAIEELAVRGQPPQVVLTHKAPIGSSGAYFDAVDRQYRTSIPRPRLPATEAASTGQ